MKKIFTLALLMFTVSATFAQGYVFTDKDGNELTEGANLTISIAEEDPFGDVLMNSGLSIKNVSAATDAKVAVEAKVTKIENGSFQFCFPEQCHQYKATGTYGGTKNDAVTLPTGQNKSLQAEWLPETDGACEVVFTAKTYQGVFAKGSTSITVVFKYSTEASVSVVKNTSKEDKKFYDLMGRKFSAGKRGIMLKRRADGTIYKHIY